MTTAASLSGGPVIRRIAFIALLMLITPFARSYQTNIDVMNTAKNLLQKTLQLGS